jgi:diaminohydroxyphosphoribosylaminopyrimidine deaminase/5-amino-6-(5-phosphoribosylamino)uracil reductase
MATSEMGNIPMQDKEMRDTDEKYMRRCIQLARNGAKNAPPNPMVGAVVVCDGRIIGEGYHVRCGEGHAEVNALASVSEADLALLEKSTIYVSLEPCSHYGKTPPCADLIVAKRLKRVVVGCLDPFAKVQGRGVKKLQDAGIDVTVGVLEKECMALNKHFMTFHSKHRPFVTLKWAQSADGFIGAAEGEPRAMISNNYTMALCHKRRTEHQAIMVGRRTAELDNPSLTVREWDGRTPLRVVLDRENKLPRTLRLFDGEAQTLVFTDTKSEVDDKAEYARIDFSADVIGQVMKELHSRNVQTLLVEGGRALLQSFIDSGLWDEAFVEEAPFCLGSGVKAPVIKKEKRNERFESFGHQIWHFLH